MEGAAAAPFFCLSLKQAAMYIIRSEAAKGNQGKGVKGKGVKGKGVKGKGVKG